MNFTGDFKDTKKETPKIKLGSFTVNVYFICNNILYKGEYHTNGHYYAYKLGGDFDCFASKDGVVKGLGHSSTNEICTHWCYLDEFTII